MGKSVWSLSWLHTYHRHMFFVTPNDVRFTRTSKWPFPTSTKDVFFRDCHSTPLVSESPYPRPHKVFRVSDGSAAAVRHVLGVQFVRGAARVVEIPRHPTAGGRHRRLFISWHRAHYLYAGSVIKIMSLSPFTGSPCISERVGSSRCYRGGGRL